MSQDFIPYDTPSTDISKFRYDTPENSTRIATVMREMYRAIASCNKILEEIEHTDVSFYNPGQKEIITGELYALRGALHFDLLRLFHPTVTRRISAQKRAGRKHHRNCCALSSTISRMLPTC